MPVAVAVATLQVRGAHARNVQRALRKGVPLLRAALDEADRRLPAFVLRELERTGSCGDPEAGFAWMACTDCDHHVLVPFSCKCRGTCPSCIGRRMAERARRWCESLFPFDVPHRQWVFTVPWPRRPLIAYRPELAKGFLDRVLGLVFAWLREQAEAQLGVSGGRAGAVTVEQRFGSSLALNLHFHAILPDGVFARDPEDGVVRFHRLAPDRAAIDALVERIADTAERWLEALGVDDDPPDPDDTRAVLAAASAQNLVASGARAGKPVRRVGTGRVADLPDLGSGSGARGYGLHAGTVVAARDRKGLEQLARYLLRPPLANDRLVERPDGWHLRLRKPWRDGTTGFLFSTLELTEKLAALVPRPRVHNTHFHGVFAANAAWRPEVVPSEARRDAHAAAEEARGDEKRRRRLRRRATRLPGIDWCPWADILAHVFAVDGLRCPLCARPMTLRAVVHRHQEAGRILAGLRRSARAPPASAQTPAP